MKRVLVLLSALLTLSLLPGCAMIVTSPKESPDALDEVFQDLEADAEEFGGAWDQLFDRLENDGSPKTHRWQILNAQGEEILLISSEEGVAAVDALLQDDGWAFTGEEPGEALYTYVFWQQKTLLAGQDPDTEREYEALIRFTVPAEGDVVVMKVIPESLSGMEIAGLNLDDLLTVSGKVPAEALEALRNPDHWSE